MEENAPLTFLSQEVEERIKGIDDRRIFYRKKAASFFSALIILTAINTLILGLKTDFSPDCVKNIALLISCVLTVLSGYNSYYSYKELWSANNNALNRFYSLRFNVNFLLKTEKTIDEAMLSHLKQEYQAILDELNQSWFKSKSEQQISNKS
ncbi:hypothetical protein LX99_02862 [Mucilaginibacter oryzae]|uniref:SMODS and SLOG-associating 2TM effector domain-containing protein n=1 Tax=Mucilaginibacter oryzae TaxID=468058 RepID=A0A316HQ30_9SPHI|nr:SLATT domain-containing protein [Mucilaginibacter oryzae]PWK77052.1 hypothetical protein LX99_02862 [Mucilaginibacter oryzae]